MKLSKRKMKFLSDMEIESYCKSVEDILTKINDRVSLKKKNDNEIREKKGDEGEGINENELLIVT